MCIRDRYQSVYNRGQYGECVIKARRRVSVCFLGIRLAYIFCMAVAMCVVSCPIICDYGVAVSRASTPPCVFGSAVLYRCSEETMTIKRRRPDQQRASVSEQLVTESGGYSRGQPERSRAASQRVQATAEFVALRRRAYHVTATSRGRRTPVFRRPRRRTCLLYTSPSPRD